MVTPFAEKRDVRTRLMRTPAMAECTQRFSLGPKHPPQPDEMVEQLDSLTGLVNQTWNVWGVSTLFGFQPTSELQLKLYSKKLREEVAGILPHENVTYDAQFTVMESMSIRPSPTDAPAIKIEITTKSNEKDDIEKTIYTGILLSWRTISDYSVDNSMKLPLLLCRGTKSAMSAVHMVIGSMFDCIVVTLPAVEDELMWLVPIMLNPTAPDEALEKGVIRLEYRIPGLSATDTISVNFELPALTKMWIAICDNEEDEAEPDMIINHERVSKFHEVIKTQMLEVAGLQLGLCSLNKISLPSFTITDNRMKATTVQTMNRFLLFFNHLALTVLHTLDSTQTTSETIGSQ